MPVTIHTRVGVVPVGWFSQFVPDPDMTTFGTDQYLTVGQSMWASATVDETEVVAVERLRRAVPRDGLVHKAFDEISPAVFEPTW